MHQESESRPPSAVKAPQLMTIKKASQLIGVQYRQLLQAVQEGVVPHYQLARSRKMVRADEVLDVMKIQSQGEIHES